MSAQTASVGVDVDSLCHYYRIHGLDEREATNAAWEIGVPRFIDLFADVGIPATFYCIAEDLDIDDNATRIKAVADAGHEIGNHTWHHRYELSQLSREEMSAEVGEARALLEAASGTSVVGFRAPGYNTNSDLTDVVFETGHVYDTSVFPCAPYYLAKAGVLGWMRLRGRRSRSILGHPGVLAAPRDPYVMGTSNPYRRGADGGLQYPVSVAGGVPLIGTAFSALGTIPAVAATRLGLIMRKHLTIEFHAVDLLGLHEDQLDPRLAMQPDLKIPVEKKQHIFREVLERVAMGARVERLDTLARERGAR